MWNWTYRSVMEGQYEKTSEMLSSTVIHANIHVDMKQKGVDS